MVAQGHKNKNWLKQSSKPWILLLFTTLILIYVVSLAEFLVQPPSEDFSNELYVDTVDYGAIKNMKTAVMSEVSDEGITTVVAIDGHKTKIIQLDAKGQVTLSKQLALDLYSVKELSMKVTSTSTITLFYLNKNLHQVNLNFETEQYFDKIIGVDIDSYLFEKNVVCIKEKDTLKIAQLIAQDYLVNEDWVDDAINFAPILETTGITQDSTQTMSQITSYAMDVNDNEVTLVYNTKEAIVHQITTSAPYTTFETKIFDKVNDVEVKYFREIEDMITFDNQVIVLFTYINKRFEINTLSVVRYDTDLARPIQAMQHDFTIQKGTIELDSVNQNSVVVILQDFIHYGVNIIKTTWQDVQSIRIEPLTKTKIYSVEGDFDITNRVSRLIFSDRQADRRVVYYASSQPELIQATTRLSQVNVLQLSVVSILVMIMSVLPSITTYFIKTALIPGIILFVATKVLPEYRYKKYFNLAVIGLVQYYLTLVMSHDIMQQWSRLQLVPLGITQPFVIYLLLAVIAVLAYVIVIRRLRRQEAYEKSPFSGYLVYLFTVYISYVLFVVVYIYTELIVGKV